MGAAVSNRRLFKPPAPMTERRWQTAIQDSLKREGFRYQHVYRSKLADGTFRTTTVAVGWPDLVAFKDIYVVAIECKKNRLSKATPQQLSWLETFRRIPTGYAWVLSADDDWQQIANWLHDLTKAPKVHGWEPHPFPIPG